MPDSYATFPWSYEVSALSVSFAIQPRALVSAPITPRVLPPAVLFIAVIISTVLSSIRPRIFSFSMHHTIFPLPLIHSTISPAKGPLPFVHIMIPLAFIKAVIFPIHFSESVLVSLHELPIVSWFIGISVSSFSIGLIFRPEANVFWAITFEESAPSMGHIMDKYALIELTVWVVVLARSAHFV